MPEIDAAALTAKQQVVLQLLQQAIERISHLEQVLLGLATLGFVGWGFLHAAPARSRPRQTVEPAAAGVEALDTGKTLFTIIFSGMIASAFNGIYLARMAINKSLLTLEANLQASLQLAPDQLLYLDYFRKTEWHQAAAVYFGTAAFLPAMSLCSLLYVLFQAHQDGLGLFSLRGSSRSIRSQVLLLQIVWLFSVGMTLGMSVLNSVFIVGLLRHAYRLVGNQ